MEKMNRKQMIEFLRDMNKKKEVLDAEKTRILSSVETIEAAIKGNTYSHPDNIGAGFIRGYDPDKVLKILLNSERDIQEEIRCVVTQMESIYEIEDMINSVRHCLILLSGSDGKMISEVFIEHKKVSAIAEDYSFCQTYFYTRLNQAVDRLVNLYNSECERSGNERAEHFRRDIYPYMPSEEPA